MDNRVSRREFLKSMGYLVLGLPILSFIIPRWKKTTSRQQIKPHEASFYRRLAG